MQGVRAGDSNAGENMNLDRMHMELRQLSFSVKVFVIIAILIIISVSFIVGFAKGFDAGQNAYSKFLDDNDIYCIDKSNEIFNQIGITFMNKSEIREKLNARIPD